MDERRYLFEDVKILINYLLFLNPEISSLRLQKTLYFMYAYYGATYGRLNDAQEKVSAYEGGFSYPPELFSAQFEAWAYGPVINNVYDTFKNNEEYYIPADWNPTNTFLNDVKDFLNDLMNQLNGVGDFRLVELSQMDDCWKLEYEEGLQRIPMDNQKIISEYIKKYV